VSEFDDIQTFRERFGMHMYAAPTLDIELLKERNVYLNEEIYELNAAIHAADIVEVADALVDIVYIVKGTAAALGMNWEALWNTVHASNMAKARADTVAESKRGIIGDVYKPDGWIEPDIVTALQFQRTHVQPQQFKSILSEAADIMENRGQEAIRAYGPMEESMMQAALIASTMSEYPMTADDVLCAIIGIKLSREKYMHKRDNMLDAVAYISALNDFRERVCR
jgi:predicted HAD superfamily Cof-like phosphohydrolase